MEGRYARCSLTTKIKALRALSALSALRSGEEDAAAAGDRTEGAKTKSITGAVGGRDGGNNPYGDVNGDVHDTKRREVKTAAPAATSTSTSTSGNGDHRHAATEGANDNCLCVGHHYFMEVLPDLIELAHSSSSSFPASPASPVSGGARPSRRLPIKARKEVRRRSLQVMGNLASSASNCTLLFNTPRFMQVVQLLQSESLELTAADKNDEGGNGRDSSVTPLLSSTVTATDSKSVEIITSIYRRLALSASVLPVLLEKHGVCRSLLHVLRIPVQRRPEILRAHYHALAALRTVLRFPSTHHHHQQYLSSSPRQASPSLLCSPSAVVVEAGGIAVLCSLLDSVMTRIQAEAARVLVAIILHSCPLTCTAYTTASKPSLCSSTSSSTVTGVANTGSTAAMRAASASADCLRDRICQSLLSLPASLSPLAHLCLLLESQHRLLHREALAAIDCLASLGVPPSPLSPVSPQISSSSSPVLGPLALAQHRLIARERGNDEKDATPVSSSSQIGAPTLSRPAAAEKETKKACQAPALLALIASRLEQEIEDSKRGGCAGDEMGADNHDTKRETNLQIPMLVSIIHNLIEFARSDAEHEVILLDVLPSSSPPSSSTPAQPSLVRRLLLACEELQSRSAGDCRHSAADMRMRHKTKLQVVVEALTERITSEKVCQ